MRVATKLTLSFGAAILIGLVIGLIGYSGARQSDDNLDTLYASNFIPVTALSDLAITAQSHQAEMYRHVIAPDKQTMDALVSAMKSDEKVVMDRLDVFRASDMSGEEKATFNEAEKGWKDYLAVAQKAIPLSESGQDKEAADLLNGEGTQAFNKVKTNIGKLVEINKAQAKESYEASDRAVQNSTRLSVTVLIMATLGLAAIGYVIQRNLLKQLGAEPDRLVEATRRIAQGDLSHEVDIKFGDTHSVMGSTKEMQAQLRQMLAEITTGATKLAEGAATMQQLADESATRAQTQNDAASTIAAAVEELTVSVSHINDNTQHAQKQAEEAKTLAENGNTIIGDSLSEVQRIESSVSETANVIAKLESESANISAIVNVIREIADQTNLLALNAAIEAARAGEQGRGFAVVADEVRKLAERTGQSTKEISQLILNIQQGTHLAAESMANGMKRVQSGVELSSRAGEAISGISGSVSRASEQVVDISSALSEQTAASTDIARNVEVIASMSQENTVSARQVSDASRDMSRLAEALSREVGRFRC